jgi:DNA polymerase-3 subunit alpha
MRMDGTASLTMGSRQPIVRLAGMISSVKKLVTREKKEQYARFKLEDLYGEIEVVVFPRNYKNGMAKYIIPNSVVVVKGRFSDRGINTELLAEEIMYLDEAKKKLPAFVGSVHLEISSAGLGDDILEKIKTVIGGYPGESPVYLEVNVPGHGAYSLETGLSVKTQAAFFKEIEKILGPEALGLRQQR